MTGYHSLTTKNDPTVEEIVAAWGPIKEKLLKFQASGTSRSCSPRSVRRARTGSNTDPWNYFMYLHAEKKGRKKEPDHGEQADCFRALSQVWRTPPPGFKGMYIWNWWRHEDPKTDYGYSVFGKPAYRS